jgi:YD repeat-containing protein
MNTSGNLLIFSFNNSTGPVLINNINVGGGLQGLNWSPDGRFIAVVNYFGGILSVYQLNGNSIPVFVGSLSGSSGPTYVAWSPDGKFLALVEDSTNKFQVIGFNGATIWLLFTVTTASGSQWGVAWSPDGRFIAITSATGNWLAVFLFNGYAAPTLVGGYATTASGPQGISWSQDGRFISVGCGSTSTQIFSFDAFHTPRLLATIPIASGCIHAQWSPDGQFIATCDRANSKIQVFRVNYVSTNPNTQALSQSIVFGNSALGSSYDATVDFLSGSNVILNGQLNVDNVN